MLKPIYLSLIGKTFNKLKIAAFSHKNRGGRFWWTKCECDGANSVKTIREDHIVSGRTKSCGCLFLEVIEKSNVKHGMARKGTRRSEHWIWTGMIARCQDLSNPDYGGRGIKVCDEWQDTEGLIRFLNHVGQRPSAKHSIDRYPNPDGNYEPGNVRWATRRGQNRNYSRNKFAFVNGERLCLLDAAERLGFPIWAIHQRVRRGWSIEKAINTPLGPPGTKYKTAA